MKYIYATLMATLCALIASQSRASLIHPNVMGATVSFTNIVESSPTGDPLPLYGQPSTNGDELLFPTTGNFSASSLDGVASDQTDGKLSLMIRAKPGFTLDSFHVAENGLTTLNAPFEDGDAYTEVVAFAVVKVAEIAGAPVNLPAFNVFLNIAPLGGQYLLSDIGGASYSTGWAGGADVGLPAKTTKVNLTLNNNLFATTLGSGTRAFIDKKSFEIDVDTRHPIPEPASAALALAGGSLLFCWAVRFKQS